jgi:putative PIN family toxin of toxin-antitoxin system
VKIVLDTSILVRANEHSHGIARDLLIQIIEDRHTLLISNEMLHELSRVLRYPRLQAVYHLSEDLVYGYIAFLRLNSKNVELDPLIPAPIRDVNDIIVMQTAIIGEADILCSSDDDFFERPAREYLEEIGITVVDDVAVIRRLDTQ